MERDGEEIVLSFIVYETFPEPADCKLPAITAAGPEQFCETVSPTVDVSRVHEKYQLPSFSKTRRINNYFIRFEFFFDDYSCTIFSIKEKGMITRGEKVQFFDLNQVSELTIIFKKNKNNDKNPVNKI